MSRVLLLQEPNEKYLKEFIQNGYDDITQIPVLQFSYYNLNKLQMTIKDLISYSGLIFTSKRAVEAFIKVADDETIRQIIDTNYTIYVVGRSCEDPLKSLGLITKGSDSRNAEDLATVITSECSENSKPLLFIRGDLARETIPSRLKEKNISLHTITCYSTTPNTNFLLAFKEYINAGTPDVIVFFSPSGAEFFLEDIENLIVNFNSVKIVSIGRTTESAIVKLGRTVDAFAAAPNPGALIEAIRNL